MSSQHFITRAGCPACQSPRRRTLYEAEFVTPPLRTYLHEFYSPHGGVEFEFLDDARYILDECVQCGLVYQRQIPDDFLLTKLYEEWIEAAMAMRTKSSHRDPGYFEALAREIEMLIRHSDRPSHELQVFDFGMGWGEWCRMAMAHGCRAAGTELSQARIDFAKASGVEVLTWDEIPERQFDFINTEQVFEHLAQPLETMLHLGKALKPGGILRISVPNGGDLRRRLRAMDWSAPKASRNSLNAIAPLEHINCFTPRPLCEMATRSGLAPVNVPGRAFLRKKVQEWTIRDVTRPVFRRMLKAGTGEEVGPVCAHFVKLKRG